MNMFYIMCNITHNQTVDSVIDRDTCDDPHVCKNLQEHPWIWHKIYELTVMFLSNYSQQYPQSLTGEIQDNTV